MTASIDHHADIIQRDKRTKYSLLGFSLIIVAAIVLWLSFAGYL
jgi:hypothetical protein